MRWTKVAANREHIGEAPSPLAVAAGEFLDYLAVERGLARNTIAAYRRDLTTYCAYLERTGIASFEDVSRRVIEDFIADRRDGGYSDARWSARSLPSKACMPFWCAMGP